MGIQIRRALAEVLAACFRHYPLSRGQGRFVQYPVVQRFAEGLPGEMETRTRSGVPIFVSPQDYLGRMIYFFGTHEPANLALLRRLLPPNGVFWDIGANYGLFSLELSKSHPNSRIVAVEPQPRLVRLLQKSLQTNPTARIRVLEKAVASTAGTLTLSVPSDSFARASLVERFEGGSTFTVETVPLDALIEHYGSPDVVKIDVEGAELDVLRSGVELLRNQGPTILMEVNDARHTELGSIETIHFLADLGYDFFAVPGFPNSKCSLDLPLKRGHDVVAIRSKDGRLA